MLCILSKDQFPSALPSGKLGLRVIFGAALSYFLLDNSQSCLEGSQLSGVNSPGPQLLTQPPKPALGSAPLCHSARNTPGLFSPATVLTQTELQEDSIRKSNIY